VVLAYDTNPPKPVILLNVDKLYIVMSPC
jgi:hypothetical protein